MRATLLLADAAQAVGNKLYVLGGGWSICPAASPPMSVGVVLFLDPSELDREYRVEVRLEDADGRVVLHHHPDGGHPLRLGATITPQVAVALPPGSPHQVCLAFTAPPLALAAGQRYTWRLTVGDDTPDGGLVSFTTFAAG